MIESAGLDLDEHLAWTRFRVGDFTQLEPAGTAVGDELDGLHGVQPTAKHLRRKPGNNRVPETTVIAPRGQVVVSSVRYV